MRIEDIKTLHIGSVFGDKISPNPLFLRELELK